MNEFYKQLNLKPNNYEEVQASDRNLACIVAISDEYVKYAVDNIHRLSNWDVCILTDQPEKFSNIFRVDYYENAVFSLVDKILYPIKIAIELKRGAVLIDADDLEDLDNDFINQLHNYQDFFCIETWTICNTVLYDRDWGKAIFKHIDLLNLPEDEFLKPPLEKVLYVPYIKELSEIRYYTEVVKPSIDHASIFELGKWKTLGQGEGAALAIALKRVGLEFKFFEKSPIIAKG